MRINDIKIGKRLAWLGRHISEGDLGFASFLTSGTMDGVK